MQFWSKIVYCTQKVQKIHQMLKKVIFLKIQLWASGRDRSIIGRFVAGKVRSIRKSGRNFLSRPKSKIDDFIQKKIPPPKKNRFFFWGGYFLKMSFESHVSQHD